MEKTSCSFWAGLVLRFLSVVPRGREREKERKRDTSREEVYIYCSSTNVSRTVFVVGWRFEQELSSNTNNHKMTEESAIDRFFLLSENDFLRRENCEKFSLEEEEEEEKEEEEEEEDSLLSVIIDTTNLDDDDDDDDALQRVAAWRDKASVDRGRGKGRLRPRPQPRTNDDDGDDAPGDGDDDGSRSPRQLCSSISSRCCSPMGRCTCRTLHRTATDP